MTEGLELGIETLVTLILLVASCAIVYFRPKRFAREGGNIIVIGALLVTLGRCID